MIQKTRYDKKKIAMWTVRNEINNYKTNYFDDILANNGTYLTIRKKMIHQQTNKKYKFGIAS